MTKHQNLANVGLHSGFHYKSTSGAHAFTHRSTAPLLGTERRADARPPEMSTGKANTKIVAGVQLLVD